MTRRTVNSTPGMMNPMNDQNVPIPSQSERLMMLLEQSMQKKQQEAAQAESDIAAAKDREFGATVADNSAKILAALANRNRTGQAYFNRMQDLGKAPQMTDPGSFKYEGNLQGAAEKNTMSAQQKLEQLKAQMQEGLKQRMGLAGQLDNQAFQQAEAQRQQSNFDKSFGLQQDQFGLSKQKLQADEAAVRAKMNQDQQSDMEKRAWDVKGRYEGTQDVKDFRQVDNSFRTIQSLAKTPSPSNDISLVFNFMKMNDPGSTVREGEYATASNAGGVEESVRNMYNKMMDGLILQPEQRNNFVNTAGILYNTRVDGINKLNQEYQNFGAQNRYPTENILLQPQRYQPTNPNNPSAPMPNDQFDLNGIDAEIQRRGLK